MADTRAHSCCGEFSKQPLSASIFSFSFQEIPPIQAPLVQTSTWPLTQPSLALSQESCSRPLRPRMQGFSHPGPHIGPRGLTVLKHSSYHLIFQCRLQFLVSDLDICWNTVDCSLCSSDQLGISLLPAEVDSAPTNLATIFKDSVCVYFQSEVGSWSQHVCGSCFISIQLLFVFSLEHLSPLHLR